MTQSKASLMLAAAVVALPASVVLAQTMTSMEIKTALEGNSISNENEVQYFNPDGTAMYQKGSQTTSGHWRIEGDKLCSDLSTDVRLLDAEDKRTGWQCHAVMGDSKRIAFVIAGHAYSWTVSKGNKVK
ncbi:hypothetical protein QO004_000267 [Rhizobium mesoamericanum]|uniref:hypothetical protein n=1 Tax=Rhizobium mesoamericanum TaxID=1079800 RepID=UPI00278331D9|nr:hypothetical protein [Rhizobium mesoamericanum]MDQ0558494.1 hypothetical protein [Rhizobium mesoamericanum]